MRNSPLSMSCGVALIAVSVVLFARFWSLTGTQTPASRGGGQMTSSLDWAAFFASPLIALTGLGLIVWALLQRSGHHGS